MDFYGDNLEELDNCEKEDELGELIDYLDGEPDIADDLSDENLEVEDYLNEETNDDIVNENIDEQDYLDDIPKVLKREITPEVLESREADIQEQIDGYRENLEQYNVPDYIIDEFLLKEREKIELYYQNLDNGDLSSDIYYPPTNWELEASRLKGEDTDLDNIMRDVLEQNVKSQNLPSDSKVNWSSP